MTIIETELTKYFVFCVTDNHVTIGVFDTPISRESMLAIKVTNPKILYITTVIAMDFSSAMIMAADELFAAGYHAPWLPKVEGTE